MDMVDKAWVLLSLSVLGLGLRWLLGLRFHVRNGRCNLRLEPGLLGFRVRVCQFLGNEHDE